MSRRKPPKSEVEQADDDLVSSAKQTPLASLGYVKSMSDVFRRDTSRCADACREARARYLAIPEDRRAIDLDAFEQLGFWYRTLTRLFCSEVEGCTFLMRQAVLWAAERNEIRLTCAEETLLREQRYRVRNRSIEIIEGAWNSPLDNLTLVFDLFPKAYRDIYRADYGRHGWQKLRDIFEIRNELTHPHGFSGAVARPTMFPDIEHAMGWFYESFGSAVVGAFQAQYALQARAAAPSDSAGQGPE